jgi:N-acetylneuraminate synthase/N,N'-diacetyllegionaminate synthase
MAKKVKVADRWIGEGEPVFIIAEAGVNHNGSLEMAKQLVDAARKVGADAVKFQTFKAEKVVSSHAPKAAYQKSTTDPAESQLEMVRRLELSYEAFRELKAYCDQRSIIFMSTPFDEDSVDFLESLDVPVFKVPSGEVINHPFLKYIAQKGKPLIMSTGMSYLSEVDEAVRAVWDTGNELLVLLHCVSNYPADPTDANLRAMQTMATAFQVPVGYSDHTLGIEIPLAAVALGACAIEKHFTLDRDLPGPDHRASLEPAELKAMVDGIRKVEQALGIGHKMPASSEEDTRCVARRSLVLREDVPKGALIQANMLTALRPAGGIPPNLTSYVVGRKAAHSLKAGAILQWGDFK